MKLFRSLFSAISIITIMTLAVNLCYASSFPLQQESSKKKEKVDSITLTGKVLDRTTTHDIIDTKIQIMNKDSIVVASSNGGSRFTRRKFTGDAMIFKEDSTSKYSINIPRIEGDYLIKISKAGYEPYYFNYTLKLGRRDIEKEIPNIYLSRQNITTLEEFTVKTSKVMFYNKGDTIVYNADAFALPEGSMLDALVSQMPGVTIKNNKIYVNGRFVESLFLNGKDFFKGNKSVMMQNIGAYAVKDISVYEKSNDMEELLGDRNDIDKEYVMDVRLKKDYMTGYMVNAEAGGGTHSRYIGRLFAMMRTNNSRFALYGNTNNINKSNNLSENDQDFSIDKRNGITTRTNGGMDYNIDNALKTWEFSGNVDVSYNNRKNQFITNEINYLQDITNYQYSNQNYTDRRFSVSTQHNFKIKRDSWNINIKPQFDYNRNRFNNEEVAATFNEDIQNLNEEIIRSLYSGNYESLRKALVNRNITILESKEHGYKAQFNTDSRIKIPGSPDGIALKFQTKYTRSSKADTKQQDICYGFNPATSQLLDQFGGINPHYTFNIQMLGRYFFNIPVGSLNASYEFAHTQSRKNSDISRLETFAQNGMAILDPYAMPIPDLDNSYTSKSYQNEHRLKLKWSFKQKYHNGTFSMKFEPQLFAVAQNLYYRRGEINATPSRNFFKLNIPTAELKWSTPKNKWEYKLNFIMEQEDVNLVDLIDYRNTTDPLNIFKGNPDLKNSIDYSIRATINSMPSQVFRQSIRLYSGWTQNRMVTGYSYDSTSGVRTSSVYNVSGNHSFSIAHELSYRFGGVEKKFLFDNALDLGNRKSINMIGNDKAPSPQSVNSNSVADYASLKYDINKNAQINLSAGINWEHTRSSGLLPVKNNSGKYRFRISGWYRMPWNLTLSSNLVINRPFGYIEKSMNTFEWIWNAELTYSIRKGMWRIGIKANDILNQDKGLIYYESATGRTQTLNTVLPRYVMLTVHYRFNSKAKKRAK